MAKIGGIGVVPVMWAYWESAVSGDGPGRTNKSKTPLSLIHFVDFPVEVVFMSTKVSEGLFQKTEEVPAVLCEVIKGMWP
mmetsp:Transcript_12534/g.15191  ORF Transcript_12534/g.15191 Transcript_12534/m.15191 type:complete len:80 (+) Transcript_12534:70-309(+)